MTNALLVYYSYITNIFLVYHCTINYRVLATNWKQCVQNAKHKKQPITKKGARCALRPRNDVWPYIYIRHQIVRNEFEIGDVSTDFSKRTSWWAREDLGRARTWKSMKNGCVCLMYTNTINYYKCIELISFWKKLGASWTKRWCPRSPNWYRSSNGHIIRVKQNADTKTFKSGSISIGFAWDRMQNW
jgi:hypothetical protein